MAVRATEGEQHSSTPTSGAVGSAGPVELPRLNAARRLSSKAPSVEEEEQGVFGYHPTPVTVCTVGLIAAEPVVLEDQDVGVPGESARRAAGRQ